MSKKSLIASLVVGVMLTLSLGLYALISSVMQYLYPKHTTVALAYTSNQVDADGAGISFGNYAESKGNLKLYFEGDKFVEFNKEEGVYRLVEGAYAADAATGAKLTFKAVATTDQKLGSTTTYNVSIFKQGDENVEYVVANADNLMDVAESSYNGGAVVTSADYQIHQMADIDLKGKDWKGIGTDRSPFHGVYNGNGYKVSNMTINVTAENYTEYLDGWTDPSASSTTTYRTMALGFFPTTNGATINGLSITDAKIAIAPQVYSLVSGESDILWIRAGLLAGYARNTVINGNSAAEGETAKMAQVTGSINGFTVENQNRKAGLGGIVGVLDDSATESSTDSTGVVQKLTPSSVSYYNVNANISNIGLVEDPDTGAKVEIASIGDSIGGVAGVIRGHSNNTKLSNLDVTLKSSISYRNQTMVGGIVAYAYNLEIVDSNTYEEGATKPTNVVVNIDVRDNYASQSSFEAWAFGNNESDQYSEDLLSHVGGVAANLGRSTIKDATIKATYVNSFSINAGAVAVLDASTLTDVCVQKGSNITGYVASGVVGYTGNGCKVEYTSADVTAVDATVNGWFTAGLVFDAKDADIIGNGAKVKVVTTNYQNSNINRFLNNQSYSAGAVGYFYTTGTTARTLSGLNVDATISNGVNMAGLVCYLGNDDSSLASSQNVVDNCIVDAKLNSIVTNKNTNSYTHKVGGAIGTIYGSAQVKNVTADVKFNKNHSANSNYGVAMFGGLVARIGGVNVELTSNTVTGSAYANNAAYVKFYQDGANYNAFYQFIVGGLVGAIADFNSDANIAAGEHYLTEEGNQTYDDLDGITLSADNFVINGNTVSISLDVPYTAVACEDLASWGNADAVNDVVNKYGFLARSLGTLVGLVMNSNNSAIALIGNNDVTEATIVTSKAILEGTFKYLTTNEGAVRYSFGYGNSTSTNGEASSIGVAFSITANTNSDFSIFNAPETPETPEEGGEEIPTEPTTPVEGEQEAA